ncbi:MAG: NHLP bacteriocin export ABC transporter permease/ATPase subunit [Lactobacillales bacterium]|nr:NHLP bacteriocin export ABC transporter permease/ATPase subunit [Lactobacillales bacterium]
MSNSEANQALIRLHGGKLYFTENTTSTYLVKNGTILVYIVPRYKNTVGRRYLLHEAEVGERLPSFHKQQEGEEWTFCFVALESAEIEEEVNTMDEKQADDFVNRAKITNFGEEDFSEILLEEYRRNIVKEENFIFASQVENEETSKRNSRLIYSIFSKSVFKQKTPESGNHIYDATAYLCDRKNISIAPFSKIVSANGRRFKFQDVARISNFVTREVILSPGWYKKDSGPMIAFLEKGNRTVALLPKLKGYTAYNPSTHEHVTVDEEYAEQLNLQAQSVYRPFPNKKLSIKDVFTFALKEVTGLEIFRFILLAFIGTGIGVLLPMLNQQIYDKYIPMSLSAGILQIGMVLIACNLGNLSFTIVKNLTAMIAMSKMENSFFAAACERLFNLPSSFFRNYQAADLSERVMQVRQLFQLFETIGLKTVVAALFSIMYVVQMFNYAKSLALFGVIILVILMAAIITIVSIQTRYQSKLIDLNSKANSKMYQFLVGIEKVRGAGVEEHAMYEYLKPYVESKGIALHNGRLESLIKVISLFITNGFSIIFYFKVVKGGGAELSVGEFCGFTAAFGAFAAAMTGVSTAIMGMNIAKPLLERVKPILEGEPEYTDDSELPGELSGDIEVSNVDFSYDKDESLILENLSIHIKKGEYIGIVGGSGSGKSTLLKLLLGFEEPNSGKIFYDGRDIDSMDKRELRKKFGVVLQDGKLIGGSIFENMTITAPHATMKDAEKIAEEVGLKEDIEHMPMGMHTVLAEMGGAISGGQQQRILIARAIIGRPNILFFDEATSALDNTTQKMVTDSLERLNATRIVIAHRLSTIQECDRILVLDKGHIIESGNYDELMAEKGLFYNLAKRQMA